MARQRGNKRTLGQGRTRDYPRLLGGLVALDFANTIDGRLSANPEEFLHRYSNLVGWAFHVGLIGQDERERLLHRAETDEAECSSVHDRALQLRDAVYRVFRSIAHDEAPSPRDIRRISDEYSTGLRHAELRLAGTTWAWTWNAISEPAHPLWEVAASAVALLTSGNLGRVKECPGADDCGWLYYDASRNRTRRWCSMEGCGSRVKMRRHYSRTTQSPALRKSGPKTKSEA